MASSEVKIKGELIKFLFCRGSDSGKHERHATIIITVLEIRWSWV